MECPEDIASFFRAEVTTASWYDPMKECCVVFLLSMRRKLIGWNLVSLGTLDSSTVHPRDTFRQAIVGAAHALILAHNHPSGDPQPSEPEIKATRDPIRAGQCLKIELLDHIVIGEAVASHYRGHASLLGLGLFH